MKTSTIAWVAAAILILGIGWYFYQNASPTLSPSQNIAVENTQDTKATASSAMATPPVETVIAHGPDGFSPSTVTVAKGETVTFIQQGGSGMWVAADMHPTHEGYDGTTKNQHCPDTAGVAFDQCSVGTAYSFTFGKAGTWGYHNHVSASETGMIIVK